MKTRIKNATVVLPEGCCRTSVMIEGHRIADIDPAGQIAVDETVDATGLYLLPGVIDDQVHFREPGLTHKEDLRHATRACAKGGVTSFFEMPNTQPAHGDRSTIGREAGAGLHAQPGQLRVLYRSHTRQRGSAPGGAAGRRGSRSSSVRARAICWLTTRRLWSGFSLRRLCRFVRTVKMKRRCDPMPPGLSRETWPIIRGSATSWRRSLRHGAQSIWRSAIGIASTCCTFRPVRRRICWQIITSCSRPKCARTICSSTWPIIRGWAHGSR